MKMPSKYTICDLRFTGGTSPRPSPACSCVATRRGSACGSRLAVENAAFNRQSPIVNRQSQGMALVITLIMLSVTLVMAVAFLALAKRERGSVTTAAETTTARLAADSALNAAQAQIA